MLKKAISLLLTILILIATGNISINADGVQMQIRPTKLADILGSTHASGKYHFTDKDFLNEGADKLLDMGTRVIKLWFNTDPKSSYPYNSNWPDNLSTMLDVAKTPYYTQVFNKPFTTYVLEASEGGKINWKDGISPEEAAAVKQQFYEVSKYFLMTYKNTGKTFVLQNWEGDNALNAEQIPADKIDIAIKGMTDWLNARQDGITQARDEVGTNGVLVVGAAEVNKIPVLESFNHPLVIDEVVPNTHMDLYSLSSWGTRLPNNVDSLTAKLDYIASKAPPSKLYGAKNVMLGEFGAYESTYQKPEYLPAGNNGDTGEAQKYFNQRQLEQALNWGVVYALYWQLYCNGLKNGVKLEAGQKATNDQLKGVWLIRPDGTLTPTYNYFKQLLSEDKVVYPELAKDPKNILNSTLGSNPAPLAAPTTPSQAVDPNAIYVKVNGKLLDFLDQSPVIIKNRTLVPMRKIFEELGATVTWDDDTKTVTALKDGLTVSLKIGEATAVKNGVAVKLDVSAQILNGRTMVPLRFIGEALGLSIWWDEATRTVIIGE